LLFKALAILAASYCGLTVLDAADRLGLFGSAIAPFLRMGTVAVYSGSYICFLALAVARCVARPQAAKRAVAAAAAWMLVSREWPERIFKAAASFLFIVYWLPAFLPLLAWRHSLAAAAAVSLTIVFAGFLRVGSKRT